MVQPDGAPKQSEGKGHPLAERKRTIDESYCQIVLPFAEDAELRADYISMYGGIRLGKLLEDMDVLAATVAYLHCGSDETERLTIVTAAVDKIDIVTPDAFDTVENLCLHAIATNVGNSSLEVTVAVEQNSKEKAIIAIARFIMVARSVDGKSAVSIPKLAPLNEEEVALLERGVARKDDRRQRMESSVLKACPTFEESKLLHEIFINNPTGVDISSTRRQLTQICHPQVSKSSAYSARNETFTISSLEAI